MLGQIVMESVSILGVQSPVRLVMHTDPYSHRDCRNHVANSDVIRAKRGMRKEGFQNRISNVKPILHHKINLYLFNISDAESIEGIVIHEIIHAWQWENTPGFNKPGATPYHGPEFEEFAKKLGRHFGIPSRYIYRPDVDNY